MNLEEIKRLEEKNPKEAIIQNISRDFNLAPLFAKAHYEQMEKYFNEHANIKLNSGEIAYEAVSKEEPAGKAIKYCLKKAVILNLNHPEDLKILMKKGLSSCRQKKIIRLSNQSMNQGAYLTSEDLALLLTTSVSTIKRDVDFLKKKDILIPLRGRMKDIGRVTSHKAKIVELYLEGYQFTEIEKLTRHTEKSVQRYLKDFIQVSILTDKGLKPLEIRQIANMSINLVKEYQELYEEAKRDEFKKEKLKSLLNNSGNKIKKKGA